MWLALVVFTSGIIGERRRFAPCLLSTASLLPAACWWGTWGCGVWGLALGTLLGPEKSGAVRLDGLWVLVFLWLFGCWIVDASIFVAVLLKACWPALFGVGWVSCFCCVCVCGDKL